MNKAGELLTLQFGHYANFVGTHWWNIQERGFEYNVTNFGSQSEIDHDVLYREGQTFKGEVTYTPRLLLVDLKGSLGSLSKSGGLYDDGSCGAVADSATWAEEKIEVIKEPAIKKNQYLQSLDDDTTHNVVCDLEKAVDVWSDFMFARFHPRSVHIVNSYERNRADVPFDVFPLGANQWQLEQFQENFSDDIRKYIEECDRFQGFNVLLDAADAFSGMATACMRHLQDEYETKSIFAVPLLPSYYDDYAHTTDEEMHKSQVMDSIRILNLAMCYNGLSEFATMFTPLGTHSEGWRQLQNHRQFNHVSYNSQLKYHTSSILATALDTCTLPIRLKKSPMAFSDIAASLTRHGRKAVATSLCLPFTMNVGADLIDCLDNWDGSLTKSITPNVNIDSKNVVQIYTMRGIPSDRLKRPAKTAGKQLDMPAYSCKTTEEMLKMYLQYTTDGCMNQAVCLSKALDVQSPFPSIFNKRLNSIGNLGAVERLESEELKTVPVLSGLHCDSSIGQMIESLHTEVRRLKFGRFHQYLEAGMEKDEFTQCVDQLFDFRECYEDNYFI